MPLSTSQSRQVSDSVMLTVASGALATQPGTDCLRWYVPAKPASQGIVVRGVRVYADNGVGTGESGTIDVRNQTTTMLSSTVSFTADNTASAATLADNGQEVVNAGRYVRIDATGSVWNASSGFRNVYVQLDFDWL